MIGKVNLGASVARRLLNRAQDTGADYETLLVNYGLERFLYRLGASAHRDRFVFKARCFSSCGRINLIERLAISTYCVAATVNSAPARCGTARVMLHVDMGVGDPVWPAPTACAYPGLLDFPAPEVLAYPREAVVAEKFEAMVVLGDRNSRIKDFFDLHYLASTFGFDRAALTEAIRRTFGRRGTSIPAEPPIALTHAYRENPSRPAQVRAFARRAGLEVADDFAEACARVLDAFLSPVLQDLRGGSSRAGTWPPGGPWR